MIERYADWQISSKAEREIALNEQARISRRRGRFCFWGGLAVYVAFLTAREPFASFVLGGSFFSLLGISLYLWGRTFRLFGLARRERLSRQEEYEPVQGWLVDLMVLQGNAPTGRDRGVVWFEQDCLYFVGDRTSFGISRGQASALLSDGWWVNKLRPQFVVRLRSVTPAGPMAVGMDLVAPTDGGSVFARSDSLVQSLNRWMALTGGDDGQLPPATLGPEAPTRADLLSGAFWISFFWTGFLSLLVAVGVFTVWLVVLPVAAVLCVCLMGFGDLWYPRLRWQAWRDRGRLDKASHNRS